MSLNYFEYRKYTYLEFIEEVNVHLSSPEAFTGDTLSYCHSVGFVKSFSPLEEYDTDDLCRLLLCLFMFDSSDLAADTVIQTVDELIELDKSLGYAIH